MLYVALSPYLDISKDKNGDYHIILWYSDIFCDKRKFIRIIGQS